MKAIVANVLFGGIFGCLGWSSSVNSEPILGVVDDPVESNNWSRTLGAQSLLSAKVLTLAPLPDLSLFNVVDRVFSLDLKSNVVKKESQRSSQQLGKKQPYIYDEREIELVLGFQNAFWPSLSPEKNQKKYWGLTTIKNWGDYSNSKESIAKLDYAKNAPILPEGNSSLTLSGGGGKNLVTQKNLDHKDELSSDFKDFRGGVTYHHGLAKHLTMGTGLIYEESLVSFAQLTYSSDTFPLRTTFSLLNQRSQINLYSHVRFQPDPSLAFEYYSHADQKKLDLKWKVTPNFKVTFRSETTDTSYSKGLKVAINTDLVSISASAKVNHEKNLRWKLDSQMGGFKFVHDQSPKKSNSELNSDLFQAQNLELVGSVAFKYQTERVKQETQDFIVCGGQIRSSLKTENNKPLWSMNLGYGFGAYGSGLVAGGSISLNNNLALKVDYQSVSAKSDDTELMLKLGSN